MIRGRSTTFQYICQSREQPNQLQMPTFFRRKEYGRYCNILRFGWRRRRDHIDRIAICGMAVRHRWYTFLAMSSPVLCTCLVSGLVTIIEGKRTFWRCSGEQYQAPWQRLHHIDVGRQQSVQGWLMSGILCMTGVVKTSGRNFYDKQKKSGS